MTPNDKDLLTQRANDALNAANYAVLNSQRPDLPALDRAEHARLARELTTYARELFAIVRESEKVESPATASATASDAEWLAESIVRVAGNRDGVTFSAHEGRVFCRISTAVGGPTAEGNTIADAFASALAKDGGERAVDALSRRPRVKL